MMAGCVSTHLDQNLGVRRGRENEEASALKAVAMVTSSPRITAPLCPATEREKARHGWGETADGGVEGGGDWVAGGGSGGTKDVPSRDQQDKRKQCPSIQKSEHTGKTRCPTFPFIARLPSMLFETGSGKD